MITCPVGAIVTVDELRVTARAAELAIELLDDLIVDLESRKVDSEKPRLAEARKSRRACESLGRKVDKALKGRR